MTFKAICFNFTVYVCNITIFFTKTFLMKSWKTTLAGILQFVVVVGGQALNILDNDPLTVINYGIVMASLITLIGLFKARDNNVSSEEAGAK